MQYQLLLHPTRKAMTRYILPLFIFFSQPAAHGQQLGDYYLPITMDNTQNKRLKLLSDTTVELSSIPRHMSPSVKAVYKYMSTDTTLEILLNQSIIQGLQSTEIDVRQPELVPKLTLTKIDGGFIDYARSIIYIRAKDFPNKPYTTYIIDGKTYQQDVPIMDSYGLVKKSPKTNKSLQKRLKTISKDKCTIETIRGLSAYKRFGVKMVHGVVLINTNQ